MVLRSACAAILITTGLSAYADICRWTDADGFVHYGDRAPPQAEAQCERPPPPSPPPRKLDAYQLERDKADVEAMIERTERDLEDVRRSLVPVSDAQARFESALARARLFRARAGGK